MFKIESISSIGLLTITFSHEMATPYDLNEIDSEVLLLDIVTVDEQNRSQRDFKWNVVDYNPLNCTIQIDWKYPPWISSTAQRDILTVKLLDREKFLSPREL